MERDFEGRISGHDLAELANRWEPEASASPPSFRRATCVVCARPMTSMWHLWLRDGGFKKELHMCCDCAQERGLDKTLIVVAAYDDGFIDNLVSFRGAEVRVVSTSDGGHPTGAYINAYRDNPDYSSYLFVQDSMEGIADDVVAPFRGKGPVVAWCDFPMAFDNPEQAVWVESQYDCQAPPRGIFGPVFYASRGAMEAAEPFFPAVPPGRNEAQGSERAWAFAFKMAGIPVATLHDFHAHSMTVGDYPPFRKTFANRP